MYPGKLSPLIAQQVFRKCEVNFYQHGLFKLAESNPVLNGPEKSTKLIDTKQGPLSYDRTGVTFFFVANFKIVRFVINCFNMISCRLSQD